MPNCLALIAVYLRAYTKFRGSKAPWNCSLYFPAAGVQQHAIRLPEGASLRTVMALLAEQEVLEHRTTGWQQLQYELDLDFPFAEGAFFPDTYFVPEGASDLSVLQRAHDALLVQLQSAWNFPRA